MSKRRARDVGVSSSKEARNEPVAGTCIVVSSISAEGQIALCRGLAKELKRAALIVADAEVGRAVAPKKGAFEVIEYTTATPCPLPPGQNAVVIGHRLARPSRVAEAMAREGSPEAKLVTVVDARSFLDDIESEVAFPPALPPPSCLLLQLLLVIHPDTNTHTNASATAYC